MSQPEMRENLDPAKKIFNINIVRQPDDPMFFINTDSLFCVNLGILSDEEIIIVHASKAEKEFGRFISNPKQQAEAVDNLAFARLRALSLGSNWAQLLPGEVIEEYPGLALVGEGYDLIQGPGSWERVSQEQRIDAQYGISLIERDAQCYSFNQVVEMWRQAIIELSRSKN